MNSSSKAGAFAALHVAGDPFVLYNIWDAGSARAVAAAGANAIATGSASVAAARNLARLAETGAIGCNFEDQVVGGSGVHPIEVQCRRIEAARRAVGEAFFINARTDLVLQANPEDHVSLIDAALERARAYAGAGASGFFVPLLADLKLLERVCAHSPLPVNFMTFPGCPSNAEVASAGVARISHGPFPHRALMKQLEASAREALA